MKNKFDIKINNALAFDSNFIRNWFEVNNYNAERYNDLIDSFWKLEDFDRFKELADEYRIVHNSINYETINIVNLEQLKDYFDCNELILFKTEDITFDMIDDVAPKLIVDFRNAFTVKILDELFKKMERNFKEN